MVAMMDEGVGNVTSMLRDKGMLRDAVIVVTSDNGGVRGLGSSNGPFRVWSLTTLFNTVSCLFLSFSKLFSLFLLAPHQVDFSSHEDIFLK